MHTSQLQSPMCHGFRSSSHAFFAYLKAPVFFLLTVFVWFEGNQVQAQAVRKYSNEFLAIGVGARALGMSNAHVVSANDLTAAYWNPAGLTRLESDLQVGLMHAEYFAGIAKYDFAAVAKRLDTSSVLAFTLIRFGVDNIPNTIDLVDPSGNINYDRIKAFSIADYAFLTSYARQLAIPGLRVGGSVKIIYRNVGEFARAWGFGLDAGFQYSYKKWDIAISGRDITSTFNAWTYTLSDRVVEVFTATGNEIPSNSLEITLPRLVLGASRNFMLNDKFNLIAEANAVATFDGRRNTLIKSKPLSIDPLLGLELGYRSIIFIRAGIGNFQYVTDLDDFKNLSYQPNLGMGVRIKKLITIDYALTDIGDRSVALYSNIFSLRLDLNNKQKNAERFN